MACVFCPKLVDTEFMTPGRRFTLNKFMVVGADLPVENL